MIKLAASVFVAFIALVLPDALHAWTPGTHVVLGERVLGSLQLLPASIADLLRAFPYDFLYGSIAADTTMAKKYAPADRHCHAWHVGREVRAMAESDAMQAFGLGYLAHLAADVVAHNHFVPRQLVVTSSTTTMGHTYWESRVENALGGLVPRAARELIRLDHRAADAHLERILSPTIFSVRINRRLFRGMVRVADSRPWQLGMQVATEQSRWDITDESVEGYLAEATRAIRVALSDEESDLYQQDPNGEAAILRSKSVRRDAVRRIGRRDPDELAQVADAEFGIGPGVEGDAVD
ncbi:MAG: zinc dependent phospholipase C family protein [Gemmatimonadales bacterium]|nr:zinc dependent phospholipase C family protein [Gemmatimonadales bacterium]